MLKTDTAELDLPTDILSGELRRFAAEHDLALSSQNDRLTLEIGLGTVSIAARGGQTALSVAAQTAGELQMLRDTVADHLDALSQTAILRWTNRGTKGRLPANVTVLTVESVTRVSPSFYRVRLIGDVSRFSDPANGMHFRFLFGPQGHITPELDNGGITIWPGGGASAWHRPAYTVRAIDPHAGWLEADVFIHAGGRTTQWCARAVPGTLVALSGPGGGEGWQSPWLGMVGDETALPVIARLIEAAATDTKGEAILVVPRPEDAQAIPSPPGLTLRFGFRCDGDTPLRALSRLELPATDRIVFFAAERAEAKIAQQDLADRGLKRAEFRTAGYWTNTARSKASDQ